MSGLKSLLLLGLATAIAPLSAHAATLTVTNTADSGAGSLRQTITDAAAGDTVNFDATAFSTAKTIQVSSGQLVINKNLTITGTGANLLTIQNTTAASNTSRVFNLTGGNGITVTLSGMTITGGNITPSGTYGGGILAGTNLTLNSVVVTGNTLNFNGGGIASTSSAVTMTINNSTISNNTVGSNGSFGGGGIYSAGTLILTNSTVSGNTVGTTGGGIYVYAGTATITNSTITDNSSTRTDSISGVFTLSGAVTVKNSIIAGNRNNATFPDVATGSNNGTTGTFTSQGYNIIGNRGAVTSFNQTGDQAGTSAAPLNPLLDPLANYGGTTPTHRLQTGSPAIDKGSSTLTTDQRGFGRPVGSAADIGAFEFGAKANTPPVLNRTTYTSGINVAFSTQLKGSDADGDTLTYALANGTTPPAGLTLSSAGLLSGTPTTAGNFRFAVTVSDGKGGSATTNFAFVVRNVAGDIVAPTITRNTVPASLTRDQLAAFTLSGNVRDFAQSGIMPSGVKRVLVQLRTSDSTQAYNGSAFTTDLTQGYYVSTLGTGGAGDTLSYSRSLSFVPASLPAGNYILLLYPQDNNGNYTAEFISVTITAAMAASRKAPAADALSSGGAS